MELQFYTSAAAVAMLLPAWVFMVSVGWRFWAPGRLWPRQFGSGTGEAGSSCGQLGVRDTPEEKGGGWKPNLTGL